MAVAAVSPQYKATKKLTDWALMATAGGGLAPHGFHYDPPPYEDVLGLIKMAAAEAVDRQLAVTPRKRRLGNRDWLLYAVRDLLGFSHTSVWEAAETDREHRKVSQQNDIFKLNHGVKRVIDMLRDSKSDYTPRDGWSLNEWKSQERNRAEHEAARASLPAKLREDPDQVHWVLEEKRMRKEAARLERHYAKLQKARLAGKTTLTPKALAELKKEIDERRVARAAELETTIAERRKWRLSTPDERAKVYAAKAKAAKKQAN